MPAELFAARREVRNAKPGRTYPSISGPRARDKPGKLVHKERRVLSAPVYFRTQKGIQAIMEMSH
jgi:hypothetical protein